MSKICAQWRSQRVKYLYRIIDQRTGNMNLPLLAVSIHVGVVSRDSLTKDEPRADDLGVYKVCGTGDIVLNRMRAFQGQSALAHSMEL
jgi:type I restriction enzyme S subunit